MSDLINGLERRAKIRKARRRWMVVKDAVDERRVVLYWQEQTQRKLCAPVRGRRRRSPVCVRVSGRECVSVFGNNKAMFPHISPRFPY